MSVICCDVDGTLTDFEGFVLKYGEFFLKKFYGLTDLEINFHGYDLDEVFINERLAEYIEAMYGITAEDVLNKFWNVFYIPYVTQRLKRGASSFFSQLSKETGSDLVITTSRKKSTSDTLLGRFVRSTIIAQLRTHFIPYKDIHFFEDDEAKMDYIKGVNPILVFDDKPQLISEFAREDIKVVCLNALYNTSHDLDALRINGYGQEELVKTLEFRRKS